MAILAVIIEYLAAGDTAGVVIGVGMGAVSGLLTVWLGVKGLRWMRD